MTVTGEERVASVENVSGEGVYTVVTNAEYIVVNGIIASPFGANHMMANLYYNVHRMVYASVPTLLKLSWLSQANEVRHLLVCHSLFLACLSLLLVCISLLACLSLSMRVHLTHFSMLFTLFSFLFTLLSMHFTPFSMSFACNIKS